MRRQSAAKQVEKLAKFILENVPGEPSQDEGAVDTAIRLLGNLVEVPRRGQRFWSCKIGPRGRIPTHGDAIMREAVEKAFVTMFGADSKMCSSGWGSHLTILERESWDESRRRVR